MKNQRLGCLTPIGLIAALITVLAIAGMGMSMGGSMFSPGGLNDQKGPVLGAVQSHAELAGECQACHTAPWESASMTDRCSACHTQEKDEMTDATTLHGALVKTPADASCLHCHTEHHGPQALLTRIDLTDFPHEVTGFSLVAHKDAPNSSIFSGKSFDCTNCHSSSYARFDQVVCLDCHKKIDQIYMKDHADSFGTACLNCHDGLDSHGKIFDHSQTDFALVGKHAETLCSGCHKNQQTLPALQSTPTDCFSCHEKDDTHKGILGKDCASCHSPDTWEKSSFNHNKDTMFALTGKHLKTACIDCHTKPVLTSTPTKCAGCHAPDDPHKGSLGSDCVACHATETWKPSSFDHSRSTFQLVGKHLTIDCASCHTDQTFKGVPTTCAGCHTKDDAHKGSLGAECSLCHTSTAWKPSTFNHVNSKFPLTGSHQAATCQACHANGQFKGTPTACAACHSKDDAHNGSLGSECSLCHTTSAWKPSTFNHARSSFPLTGAHQQAACQSCHANGRFKGTPTSCASCHSNDDAHNGSLGSECSLCHTTSAWKPSTFDHARSAFPLTGAHQQAACQTCHTNGRFTGTPTACAACHSNDDAHSGSLGSECSLCHTTLAWKPATFDHARSAFPLTGSHVEAACQSCHTNGQFKGIASNCAACHAKDDHHNGQFGSECSQCHNTTRWGDATFNHSQSGFPLTGAHASVACQSCHSQGYSGTSKDCVACHAQPAYHAGMFSNTCSDCHNTSAWLPAPYNGPHEFDMNHEGAGATCRDCHPASLNTYSCVKCHPNGVEDDGDKGGGDD